MKNISQNSKQHIQKLVQQFNIATGVSCVCIFTNENNYNLTTSCNICKNLHTNSNKLAECPEALLYGAYQAERFNGKYIFYCPMGLVHFASPIFEDGKVCAIAIGGPVLLVEPEEFIADDLVGRFNINSHIEKELELALKKVRHLEPEQVTALSEMLFAVCSHISGIDQMQYLNDEESQGNDISRYIHFINTMGGDDTTNTYPIEKERQLLSLIATGNKDESKLLLDELLKHIILSSNRNFEKAKSQILELVVLLSRAALEGGADVQQIFGLNYKYLSEIHSYKTIEELSSWLTHIMVRFTDCVFNIVDVKHVDTIYKAIDYIKRNYAQKLSLEDVANYVYLSPSYFSKIFKEEVNVSFTNYLNNIRIERSKRLLLSDSINLTEISEMVGFEDQSYFSKVFKKLTGVTPSKYRSRLGKI